MFGQAVQILRAFPVTRAPQLKLEADANDNPGMRVVVVDGHPATRRGAVVGKADLRMAEQKGEHLGDDGDDEERWRGE